MQTAVENKDLGSKPAHTTAASVTNPKQPALTDAQYLRSKGWKEFERGWQDPTTGLPGKDVQIGEREIQRGRGFQPVFQHQVGSAAWYYPLEEAVAIQRERDAK